MAIHIEAVTVCVGYSDFLAVTAPYNKTHLDNWVIVTDSKDNDTKELCRKYSLKCVVTDEFYMDGAKFNKARGIIKGLDQLSYRGWVMQLDADIVFPNCISQALSQSHLDPQKIYGCDRVMCKNWNDWVKLKNSGWLHMQQDYHCRVNFPEGFPIGVRWASPTYSWVPIGFCQIWNAEADLYKGVHHKQYPVTSGNDAARTDVSFALQWDRRQRELLPDVVVAHLESEPAKLGANWNGRTTKLFGPDK